MTASHSHRPSRPWNRYGLLKRRRRRRSKYGKPTALAVEPLEDRRLLAIAAGIPPGVGDALGLLLAVTPDSIKDKIPDEIKQFTNTTLAYQAFPQETNEVSIDGNAFNFFILLDEDGDNVPILRQGPVINEGLVEEIRAGVVDLVADVEFPLAQLIGIDLPSSSAIAPNPQAITQFFPFFKDIADGINDLLDFGIPDLTIPEVKFPKLEIPKIGPICPCEILPEFTLIPELTLFPGVTLSDVLPDPVVDVIRGISDFIANFPPGGIYVNTLDGNDTIDASNLTGLDQALFGGTGDDTILPGGGEQAIESLGLPGIPGVQPRPIDVFGGPGRDTIVVNRRFNVEKFNVDGGSGNDILRIEGSDGNDIIELVVDRSGMLTDVRFLAPNPNPGASTNARQRLTLPPDTVGGTFLLTFDFNAAVETTAPLSFDATAAQIQQALENLPNIGSGNVTVSGPAGGPWEIEFIGALAGQPVPRLAPDGSGLELLGGRITVTRTEEGDPTRGTNEFQRITLPTNPDGSRFITGGSFTLAFGSEVTGPIRYAASAGDVQRALEALPSIASGDVRVVGGSGGPWLVEFRGNLALTPQPELVPDGSGLTGGVSATVTSRDGEARGIRITLPSPRAGYASLGGTFTLSLGGDTTAPIPWNASASDVQMALESLSSVGAGAVTVTGNAGGPWDVLLSGAAGRAGEPLLRPDASGLESGVQLDIQETTPGSGVNEVQRIVPPVATAGTFRLTFNNGSIARTTAPIPFDATVGEVQAALEALTSIGGPDNVVVSNADGGPWDVEFTGELAAREQLELIVDGSGLTLDVRPPVASQRQAGDSSHNEIQELTAPAATGGTFTLSFTHGGSTATTAPIPFDATAAQLRSSLEALANIGSGNVSVSGGSGSGWTIEFVGALGNTNVSLLAVDGSSLTGLPVVREIVHHVAGANERQTVTLSPSATGGQFTLTFGSDTTAPLPFNATAAQVESALQSLPSLQNGVIRVTSSRPTGGPWEVEFAGRLATTDVALLSGDGSHLTGGFADSEIDVTQDASRPGVNEVQTIAFSTPPADPQGGTFQLSLSAGSVSRTTADLPFDAGPAAVQAALEQLDDIGVGNVRVTGSAGGSWNVEFVGDLASQDLPALVVRTSELSRNEPIEVVQVQEASPTNELQTVTLPALTSGGTWTLAFDDGTSTETTGPLPFDASPRAVQAALESLANIAPGDVRVRGGVGDPSVRETATGGGGTNELQTVTLSPLAQGGSFTLAFRGATTSDLPLDATAQDVEDALEALSTIGSGNVRVTGADGGPFAVEFIGALSNADQPLLVADGTNLTQLPHGPWTIEFIGRFAAQPQKPLVADGSQLRLEGLDPTIAETAQGSNGDPLVLKATHFEQLVSVEQLEIQGNGGDDRVIVRGAPNFPLGVIFDGGDGTDYLQLVSKADAPAFVSPIFPDSVQGTLTFDGQAIQIADVEGGITLDAGGKVGSVSFSGTDEGNDIRFAGVTVDRATLANDGQVTTTITGFASGSQLTLRGEQGDDVVSVAPGPFQRFDRISVLGGGPSGADSLIVEGTSAEDTFTLTPDATDTKAGTVVVNGVEVAFSDMEEIGVQGLQGVDALTVREPVAGSNDNILFNPAVANDGSFQWTAQPSVASTALAYFPVTFGGIESRVFDTGSGTDVLTASTDDLPGVNSSVQAVGGEGTTTVVFGDQPTTFVHQVDGADVLSLEVGTTVDDVTVSPGKGVTIAVNTSVGDDRLIYEAAPGFPVNVDLAAARIEQAAFGPVTYSSTEQLMVMGNDGIDLEISGLLQENRFVYTPSTDKSGRVELTGLPVMVDFEELPGRLTLIGGSAVGDAVVVRGSNAANAIVVDTSVRRVRVADTNGRELKPLEVDDTIEVIELQGRGGDDLFQVVTSDASVSAPRVDVDGGSPDASDRLVFVDGGNGNLVLHRQGPIDRSGTLSIKGMPPVGYANIERVDILPLDPITGGTGGDGSGKVKVLDTDVFEKNDSRLTATPLEDLAEATSRPNIDPPARVGPFGEQIPGDEDWYRYVADQTGTFRFALQFDPVEELDNGASGLPGDGKLRVDLYEADGSPIARLPGEGPQMHTIGAEAGKTYYVRVRGAVPEAVNDYGLTVESSDDVGPRITGVFGTSDPAYDLFDPKPSAGPTPAVTSLTIAVDDPLARRAGFLYEALDASIAATPGHYRLVGDQSGPIAIQSVRVVNDAPVAGQVAKATIELSFFEPLPDDRFTLTVADELTDPVGNRLDGESTTDTPRAPLFPSGDGISGGTFVARFTVDSRPELGVTAATRVYVDITGDGQFNPAGTGDATNRDLIFQFGTVSDAYFAGDFSPADAVESSGFDKLGVFGWDPFVERYRFLLDVNHNGVPDVLSYADVGQSGLPVAGDFNADHPGDEIGLFTGDQWILDTNGDNVLSLGADTVIRTSMRGIPVVGDVNGDGLDDLITYDAGNDAFTIDLDRDGVADDTIEFGIPDFVERPVIGDVNLDGVDDLGLWVPGSQDRIGQGKAEWYLLVSDGTPQTGADPMPLASPLFEPYSPDPLGNDRFANFGDRAALPIFGNFDPPVTPAGEETTPPGRPVSYTNASLPSDVNGDGFVSPIDALFVIDRLNRLGAVALPQMRLEGEAASPAPYLDVSGDGVISPVDALIVIETMNRSAEGEAGSSDTGDSSLRQRLFAEPDRIFAENEESTDKASTDEPNADRLGGSEATGRAIRVGGPMRDRLAFGSLEVGYGWNEHANSEGDAVSGAEPEASHDAALAELFEEWFGNLGNV